LERDDASCTGGVVEIMSSPVVPTLLGAFRHDRSAPAAVPVALRANAPPHPKRRRWQGKMLNFLFKCSRLEQMVQGSIEESAIPEEGLLVPYECPACGATHLVDPRSSEDRPPSLPPRPA
jgi:hypothetical protein